MANILNIETSGKKASICLTQDSNLLELRKNDEQKEQAAWLHSAIGEMIQDAGLEMNQLDAIAVSWGPGSYTGLRLGMATAKGLCYALQKPLLCIPTLEIMALAAGKEQEADFYCPMIDARRMEVFAAVYDNKLTQIQEPVAWILEEGCLNNWLERGTLLLTGDGAAKAASLHRHPNLLTGSNIIDAAAMSDLSVGHFQQKKWADLAYVEPFYLKEFYTPGK